MDKKGLTPQIITMIIMGIVLVGLMVLLFIAALAGPVITSTFSEVNDIVQDVTADMDTSGGQATGNATFAAEASIGNANETLQQFEWISYTMFFMVFLTFIIMCFYVRTYPFLAFVWIFIMVLVVFLSIFLTVIYQDLSTQDAYLAGIYQSWETNHLILSNLPHIMTMIGIMGGAIMLMLIRRDKEAESIPL